MYTISLNSTPSSVVTDPPQLLLTAVATSILSIYSILENKSWGSPSCCGKLQSGWLQIITRVKDPYITQQLAS